MTFAVLMACHPVRAVVDGAGATRAAIDGADYVRWIGGVLQIAGVSTIAYEIWSTRRALYGDVVIAPVRAARWIRRRARAFWIRLWRGQAPSEPVRRTMSDSARVTDSLSSSVNYGDDAVDWPVERTLKRHLDIIRAHQRAIEDLFDGLDAERTARAEAGRKIVADARAAIDGLRETVEHIAGDGLRLRWWSGLLIVIGIAMTTWPDGIAAWF